MVKETKAPTGFVLDENVYAVSIEENGKLGKNQNVTLPVLLSICEYLKCDFGDIMEALPDDVDKEHES